MNTTGPRIATASLLAATTIACGQARYEIGYRIDGVPEVIRTEAHPFSVIERSGEPRSDAFQFVFGTFPLLRPERTLIDLNLNVDPRLDVSTDLLTAVRLVYTVDDLVFSADEGGPVHVGLNLDLGRGSIIICDGVDCVGIEYLTEIVVELEGDARAGSTKATLDGTFVPMRERTGFLEGRVPTGALELPGFVVPANEPVSLTLEYSASILYPVGARGGSTGQSTGDGFGFPSGMPVFSVPDGIRVDSVSAQIRDNLYRPCRVDLDTDGELTVFDFLTFQNLFVAGDALADYDLDRALTLFDFLAFQNAFDAGCP